MTEFAFANRPAPLQIEADVLSAGGGMAACWAGIPAARSGAKVVLVDKGYVGTSGVTATAGPGHWWVAPEGDARKQAVDKRMGIAYGLADPNWMGRIIDTTWRVLPTLSKYYRFNVNDKGETVYNALRGPEYLRALRSAAQDAGVTILDQSPVLELLLHDDGSVAGVNGVRRQEHRTYTARAGAVILATGAPVSSVGYSEAAPAPVMATSWRSKRAPSFQAWSFRTNTRSPRAGARPAPSSTRTRGTSTRRARSWMFCPRTTSWNARSSAARCTHY